MSCNSAIYTVNSTNMAVTTANQQFVTIPFGNVVRRFGQNLTLEGGAIQARGNGYYKCDASLTVLPTAAGSITARLFLNGEPIPGAVATGSVTTAGNPVNLTLPPIFRICGCDCSGTLTCGVNESCTIPNFACAVEKK